MDAQPKKTPRRVIVFIDSANLYQDLRRAFCSQPLRPTDGQFAPMKLAQLLATRGPDYEDWALAEVRLYAGRASAIKEPRTAAAADKQIAAWHAAGVIVRDRPLSYVGWPKLPPHQKGVDVELAVDVVRLAAVDKTYDVGIMVSTDTDMLPALEAIEALRAKGGPRVDVVSFQGLRKRLRLRDARAQQPHCIVLTPADYVNVMDPTIYAPRRKPGKNPRSN